MPFKPIGEQHAIEEVVFILGFTRPFTVAEIEQVVASHSSWRSELPKVMRAQMINFVFGEENALAPPPTPAPVVFQSFKRDGNVEWQLKVEGNAISVNCLNYSRWEAISRQALSFIERALRVLADEKNRLQNVTLQYLDTFVWAGDGPYSAEELFNRESGFYPDNFKPEGSLWHLHRGEFEYFETEHPPKRILDRIHLDAVEENGLSKVRIDTTMRADFRGGIEGRLDSVHKVSSEALALLHKRNKIELAKLISEGMQNAISLNKES